MSDKEDSYLCRNRTLPTILKQRSQRLRREATEPERILWQALRGGQLGVKFRRQHAVGHVILDFYCPVVRLGIEIDGKIHLNSDVRQRDIEKTELLTGNGIYLLRFTNQDVEQNCDAVVERIQQAIAERINKCKIESMASHPP